MNNNQQIKTLFTDIGGVLLTNGWDHNSRAKAVEQFHLDPHETQERHSMTFDTYEVGKLTLQQYLERVVYLYKKAILVMMISGSLCLNNLSRMMIC